MRWLLPLNPIVVESQLFLQRRLASDEFPHVLRSGMDSAECQTFRDLPRTLPIVPRGENFVPERRQDASSSSMLSARIGTARESADGKKLFRAVMPVFGRFPFQLSIGLGSVERQQRLLWRDMPMGGNQRRHPRGLAGNQQTYVVLRYFCGHCTTSHPMYFRTARERSV